MKVLFIVIASTLCVSAAIANDVGKPVINAMVWNGAQTVCEAWPAGHSADEAQDKGLFFVSYPAAVKPFGMRGYMAIDGREHPLKQIAYANADGTLSIYYRTLGDYHYDVYLTLSGFTSADLKGTGLTGTLIASRFGLFTEIAISGQCGTTS